MSRIRAAVPAIRGKDAIIIKGIRFIRRLIITVAFISIISSAVTNSSVASENCRTKEISVQGVVYMENLRHPNGEEFVSYFLRLAEPICYMSYDREQMMYVKRMSGALVQIWEIGKNASIRAYVGEPVEIEGELLEPQGGYARASIAIAEPKVRLLSKTGNAAEQSPNPSGSKPKDIEDLVFYCISFLETDNVQKRLQALYKPDPQEPSVLLVGLYFASGPVYDRIKLRPGKADQISALQQSIRKRAPIMTDNELLSTYRECRTLFER